MLTLFYAKGTISIATAITLIEAGLPFDRKRVDFASAEQTTPEYLAINSKGRVPALRTPDGILTENGAIQDYIAAIAPEAGLVPESAFQAGQMREAMYYMASTMHVNHAHKMRGHRWADSADSHADMAAKIPQTMTESCRYVETALLRGDYVLGDRFSLADPYLFTISTWLDGDGVDLTLFPKLSAFMARMETRSSVQAVRAEGML